MQTSALPLGYAAALISLILQYNFICRIPGNDFAGFYISPFGCHSCESGKVPKIETYAVSVHETISRERNGHPALFSIRNYR
ncbi:MAG: hypothetical protein ACYCT7_05245 [bacterium]